MSIYRQSLLTQGAPTPFRRRTVGGFVGGRYGIQETTPSAGSSVGGRRGGQQNGRIPGSVSSRADEDEEDRYSLGSFVCDDDEVEYGSSDNLAGLSDEE